VARLFRDHAKSTLGVVGECADLRAESAKIVGDRLSYSDFLQVGVIAREEEYLERKFGDEYFWYQRQVRRWI
jgi:protein-S-isoprenylcysteine O-methyltransferase Ste14